MLTRLIIENVQSVKKADIELGPVTFIVGPGYVGKSSILRALEAVFTNPSGDHLIRQGAKSCRVELHASDQLPGTEGPDYATESVIVWEKEQGKGGTYSLPQTGRTFDRLGGQVPDAVRDLLGVRPFEVDKDFAVMPQVHGQLDGPFLLDESGSRIARTIGKLTKLDVIVTAQMLARKETRRAQSEDKSAAEELARLRRSLDALPDTERAAGELDELRRKLTNASDSAGRAQEARTLLPRLARARAVASIELDGLRPDIRLVQQGLTSLGAIAQVYTQLEGARRRQAQTCNALEAARVKKTEAEKAYDQVCQEAGVCEVCPWR